ncbi:MAG: ankyrin repeat domain-containing protein, partial [Candidatus Binatia bacterium]
RPAIAACAAILVSTATPAHAGKQPVPEQPSSVQSILRNADLLVACEKGHATEVRKLLREGVDPNAKRGSGATALSYAVAGRHSEVVRALVEGKADPNHRSFGLTPLFLASENGDVESIKLLLKAGADVNARLDAVDDEMKVRNGDTALIASASPGVSAVAARTLLAAGADVNAKADNGKTAVMQAIASENVEVLKVLLDAKADVSARMAAPEEIDALTLAVGRSRTDMVKLLLAAGADAMVKIDGEVSLLEFAILSEQPEVAGLLRKAGVSEPSAARIAALKKEATEP